MYDGPPSNARSKQFPAHTSGRHFLASQWCLHLIRSQTPMLQHIDIVSNKLHAFLLKLFLMAGPFCCDMLEMFCVHLYDQRNSGS